MPLQLLLDPQIKLTEDWDFSGTMYPITYYNVGGIKCGAQLLSCWANWKPAYASHWIWNNRDKSSG